MTTTLHDNMIGVLAQAGIDFGSDAFVWVLTNAAPAPTTEDDRGDLTQISGGNGYTTGGNAADSMTVDETSGALTIDCADEVITASGGSIGPFRGVYLVDETAANDEIILSDDYGSSITLLDGETFTIGVNASGLITGTLSP